MDLQDHLTEQFTSTLEAVRFAEQQVETWTQRHGQQSVILAYLKQQMATHETEPPLAVDEVTTP